MEVAVADKERNSAREEEQTSTVLWERVMPQALCAQTFGSFGGKPVLQSHLG